MERAAPPLLSPSTLVRIEPVILTDSLKLFAIFAASWPVNASATNNVSSGFSCKIQSIKLVYETFN